MSERHQEGSVQLRGLTKRFDAQQQPAVDAIDLDIRSGEFMTLLGPSGSGKTTTLNMIAGFLGADSGEIRIGGRDMATLPPHKRGLGMVFQHYALFPHLTVFDNVAFGLRRRKVAKAETARRVLEVLELVGLAGYERRLPKELSGGQQQRVALARAVVFKPPVLLMDEPLGALDKKLRRQLQGEISRMHRELGITFIFVTHDQEEALALSDRIAVFNQGRIEQVGTAEELYDGPRSVFVADFLGDSNLLHGALQRSGTSRPTLRGDGFELLVPDSEVPTGEPCALLIRPERMRIGHQPQEGTHNALGALVTEVVYQGTHRKVRFDFHVGGHGQLIQGADDKAMTPSVGDDVVVAWPLEDSVLIHDAAELSPTAAPRSADAAGMAEVAQA